jgi:predicted nucleotidyltransferase
MRTAAPSLAPVCRSDAQLRLLASLFLYGGEWTVSELAEHAEAPLSTTSREVHRLIDAGLATMEARGPLRLVRADMDLPWVNALVDLLDQTVGPIHHLRDLLLDPEWENIEQAHVYGSWARRYRGEAGAQPNDLDIVLVTHEPLPTREVLRFQRALESRIHLRVDAVAITEQEWTQPTDEAVRDLKGGATVPVHRIEPHTTPE